MTTNHYEMAQPIRGIVPPLVTPLTPAGKLDAAAVERIVEHVLAGGVHGVFILGTTGEGPSLAGDVQRDMIAATARAVEGRVPVLVGVTHPALDESLALAEFAAEARCDAIVAAPPFYFPVEQAALVAYFQQLARRSPLPTVLYNMPAVTGLVIEPATVEQLLAEPAIVALKDSSGDLQYFQAVRAATRRRVDFPLLVGPEHLLAQSLALGGDGGVSGGANVFPELFTAVYDKHFCGDPVGAAAAQAKVDQLGAIYRVGPVSIPAIIARTKSAMATRGLCGETVAPPLTPVPAEEHAAVARIVEQLAAPAAVLH